MPPDDLGVFVGAPCRCHGAIVVHDLVESGVRRRFEQFVFRHVDHRLGGVSGRFPQLLVVSLRHKHRTVVILPVLVSRIAVEQRAGDHQRHARLDCTGCADGGKSQREFLVAGSGHAVLADPVDFFVNPVHALRERIASLCRGNLVGRATGLGNGYRTVETQQQVVVIGTHETGLGFHRAAVYLAQFGTLVHVLEEDVAMADGLVVADEEIKIIARIAVVVVGTHLTLGNVADERLHDISRLVGAPEIRELAAVMHLLNHEIVAVDAVVPLGGFDFRRENLIHRVQVFGVLVQIVGATGQQQDRRQQ